MNPKKIQFEIKTTRRPFLTCFRSDTPDWNIFTESFSLFLRKHISNLLCKYYQRKIRFKYYRSFNAIIHHLVQCGCKVQPLMDHICIKNTIRSFCRSSTDRCHRFEELSCLNNTREAEKKGNQCNALGSLSCLDWDGFGFMTIIN